MPRDWERDPPRSLDKRKIGLEGFRARQKRRLPDGTLVLTKLGPGPKHPPTKEERRKKRKAAKRLAMKDLPNVVSEAMTKSRRKPPPNKAGAHITPAEVDLVTRVVAAQDGQMTKEQVRSLATVMRRKRVTVKALIENARGKFIAKAGRYVEMHAQAAEKALKK